MTRIGKKRTIEAYVWERNEGSWNPTAFKLTTAIGYRKKLCLLVSRRPPCFDRKKGFRGQKVKGGETVRIVYQD